MGHNLATKQQRKATSRQVLWPLPTGSCSPQSLEPSVLWPQSPRISLSLISTQGLASRTMLVGIEEKPRFGGEGTLKELFQEECSGAVAQPLHLSGWSWGSRGASRGRGDSHHKDARSLAPGHCPKIPSSDWLCLSCLSYLKKKKERNSCKLNNPCVGFGRCYS